MTKDGDSTFVQKLMKLHVNTSKVLTRVLCIKKNIKIKKLKNNKTKKNKNKSIKKKLKKKRRGGVARVTHLGKMGVVEPIPWTTPKSLHKAKQKKEKKKKGLGFDPWEWAYPNLGDDWDGLSGSKEWE
jgi:hypothetical protein